MSVEAFQASVNDVRVPTVIRRFDGALGGVVSTGVVVVVGVVVLVVGVVVLVVGVVVLVVVLEVVGGGGGAPHPFRLKFWISASTSGWFRSGSLPQFHENVR